MTRVKVCGITNPDDALLAARLGAEMLGFNFYQKSPRYISPENARDIIETLPDEILTVGVFVNEAIEKVLEIAKTANLGAIQLHGDESPEYVERLSSQTTLTLIKVFHVDENFDLNEITNFRVDSIMLDTLSTSARGGSGQSFDWNIARRVQKQFPKVYLAGGLSVENVVDAIGKVDPFALDACSQLEREPGQKDPSKLRDFIRLAHNPLRNKEILEERDMPYFFLNEWFHSYWAPMQRYMEKHGKLYETFSGFLLRPEKLNFYLGKTHLGIEYVGPERINGVNEEYPMSLTYRDYSLSKTGLLENIIGFNFDKGDIQIPLIGVNEDLVCPTFAGIDKLIELRWNFAAQDSIISIGSGGYELPEGQFTRLINCLFFDANENGLVTRHVKWLDLIPLTYDDSRDDRDAFTVNLGGLRNLIEHDCNYIYYLPDDYKFEKLPRINRFIELVAHSETSEPEVTRFLAEAGNNFILTMRFAATAIHLELLCEWQNDEREAIKPDFFVVQANGYADIVEFKLAELKGTSVVGRSNRETFSAEVNQYISQTRTYRTYFDDLSNRRWFENKYGFKVFKPRRYLVAGRRWNFSSDEWKEIQADYTDVAIISYDDLVDGVVAQFYM